MRPYLVFVPSRAENARRGQLKGTDANGKRDIRMYQLALAIALPEALLH